MKKSVLLLFFAGCVATGIFGIGRKIPMNRVNDLGQREGYWRDSLGEGYTHELYYKGGKKDGNSSSAGLNGNNNYQSSDFWLINGAYLRMKDVSFGYNFKKSLH